jgi:hypothetical protein
MPKLLQSAFSVRNSCALQLLAITWQSHVSLQVVRKAPYTYSEKAGVGGSTPSLATIFKSLAAQSRNFQPTIQPTIRRSDPRLLGARIERVARNQSFAHHFTPRRLLVQAVSALASRIGSVLPAGGLRWTANGGIAAFVARVIPIVARHQFNSSRCQCGGIGVRPAFSSRSKWASLRPVSLRCV